MNWLKGEGFMDYLGMAAPTAVFGHLTSWNCAKMSPRDVGGVSVRGRDGEHHQGIRRQCACLQRYLPAPHHPLALLTLPGLENLSPLLPHRIGGEDVSG